MLTQIYDVVTYYMFTTFQPAKHDFGRVYFHPAIGKGIADLSRYYNKVRYKFTVASCPEIILLAYVVKDFCQ